MIFITLFLFAKGFIRYDENTFRSFQITNKGFYCFNNIGRTQDIKFRDSFENIPKVILIPELFDIPGGVANYNLKITQITLTKFTLSIKCFDGVIYGIHYKWLAIDDQRIQVINQFNQKNFESLTLDHSNPYAQNYLISVIAFSFSGSVSFQVKVSEINTKSLTIIVTDLQNTLTNLISISYQIILGIDETFQQQPLALINSPYTSQEFAFIQSSWFLLPFYGFQYDGVQEIRFKKQYFSNVNNLWYDMDVGNFQSYATGCCCMPTLWHKQSWMKFEYITEFKPYEIGYISIKYFKDSKVDYLQSFKIEIQGDIQKATNLGLTRIIIDKAEQQTNLKIHTKCYEKETIKIILFIPNSTQNSITNPFFHSCLDSFEEVVITFTLISTSVAYQDLIVDMSETECLISQLLFNYRFSQVDLFSIQKLIN
ncbi:unnamed protein product [Paramecium primaurelia]|uniref:H-type lectin domain-containing protein n=1 Tax=Paramecium primaurelia TaxID=5886 RepID=A0A8S1P160_PARPR|nr:unnamed protein product [Paramecium primaurelia]